MSLDNLPPITRQELAAIRLARLRKQVNRGTANLYLSLTGRNPRGGSPLFDPSLSPHELAIVSEFANSDHLSDRNRQVTFHAVDPRTGASGTFSTSINNLLILDGGYDTAKTALEGILRRLENDGLITRAATPLPGGVTGSTNQDGVSWFTAPRDTRLATGQWANFPPYSGIGAAHINARTSALGYDRPSDTVLNGFPLPARWTKFYPTPKLVSHLDYQVPSFITDLDAMTTNAVTLVRGANAHPEWHPALMCFNVGPQFPGPMYPPNAGASTFASIELRYQYTQAHRWATMSSGADGASAGFQMTGRNDPLWLWSCGNRQRVYSGQRVDPPIGNAWGRIDCADATADFMAFVNLVSFLVNLGATAHVHAACETHNSVLRKAQRELSLAPTANVETYFLNLQREREARAIRLQQTNDPSGIGTALGLNDTSGQILAGGIVASAQLFMANPIAGGVALLVTGVAVLLSELLGSPRVERIPENVMVRDGLVPVRASDENGDPAGDIYGGNRYPWTRKQAVMGRPVMRAQDSAGRTY